MKFQEEITNKERIDFLTNLAKDIKSSIIGWELNIRHIERIKINLPKEKLIEMEGHLAQGKAAKNEMLQKLTLIKDVLAELDEK